MKWWLRSGEELPTYPAKGCQNGPFEVELKVHITDGEQFGVVTYDMPKGTFPNADTVRAALVVVQNQIAAQPTLSGFRLLNREEFVKELLDVPFDVAVPGPKEFPAP